MLPKPKKKKPDVALLIDEEVPEGDDYAADDDEEFADLEEDEELGDDLGIAAEGDELAAEGDEAAADIDPEQAALCKRLGFSEPDQQQAFIDLVRLITAPSTDLGSDTGSDALSLEGMI